VRAQNTPKCVRGRGFALNPTGGKLQSPRPLAGFQEPLRGRGGEREEEKEEKEEKGRG